MSELTLKITPSVAQALERVAQRENKPLSEIAAAALESFVADDAAFCAAVEAGLADRDAGRLVAHDMAIARLRKAAEQG